MSTYPAHLQQSEEELISDDVKEIISNRPHWIIRRGNGVYFLLLTAMLVATCLIQYPDMINGSTRIVGLNAPKLISSKLEGKIVKLFVHNEAYVHKGQHLGFMESTANYFQVTQLQSWIEQMIMQTQKNNYEVLALYPLPLLHDLGELQSYYQNFQNHLMETGQILSSGYYQLKIASLQKDLQYQSALKGNLGKEKELLEQDQHLYEKEYQAYESLAEDKIIAPLELNQYKSKLIAKEQSLKQISSQLTNNEIASHSKQNEILDLQKKINDQKQQFNSSLLDLKSEVEKWNQQYVLIAPEDGKVIFASSLQENELVAHGQQLLFIQPRQTQVYAELMVPQRGLGKIKQGQKVIIRLDSYPSEEYGFLNGVIQYISDIPIRRDSFLIKVHLPNGLETSYKKQIVFRNNLSANASIVTNERSLFNRLIDPLRQTRQK